MLTNPFSYGEIDKLREGILKNRVEFFWQQFLKKVKKERIVEEVRERKHYKKPSVKKKEKRERAQRARYREEQKRKRAQQRRTRKN